jgi:hypothetical protein
VAATRQCRSAAVSTAAGVAHSGIHRGSLPVFVALGSSGGRFGIPEKGVPDKRRPRSEYHCPSAHRCGGGSSVATADEPGGLRAVLNSEKLVGAAQVLLYSGLREEELPRYLGVGVPLGHVPEDLLLAGGEGDEVRGLLFSQQIPKQIPRRDELALGGQRHSPHQLVGCHLGVDETGGPCPEGLVGERQIQAGTEDQDRWCVRAQLSVGPRSWRPS